MRKKLVELIQQIVIPFWAGEIADHLLSNDVVPVVRCGECEKRDKSFVSDNDTVCCPYMEAFMPKDGFCSYGERKDGEG